MESTADLLLLRHFVAVYRTGSFRSAADELGVTQSTVTKRIQQLEKAVNMRLFNRTTRAVEPTDTARHLIVHAENVLRSSTMFTEEARLLAGGDIGSIRVDAMALAAETLITGGLKRLAATHPNLEVEVVVGSSDIYRDLATGECDVVVGDEANFEMSSFASSLRMERIHHEPLVYVHRRSHPAASDPGRLLSYPLAIPSRYFNENRLFAEIAIPRYRLNSLSACLSLVAGSNVITLAPQSVVAGAGADQDIVVADIDTQIDVTMVLVTVARNTPTPSIRAFQAAITT